MKKHEALASIQLIAQSALGFSMLRLCLLRHAEAASPVLGGDISRPLTETGRSDATRMGAYFRKCGLVPDLVLVSPASRALETLDLVEREMKLSAPRAEEPLLYNASPGALEALIAVIPNSAKTLLIVGHNPILGEFVAAHASEAGGDSLAVARRRQFPTPFLAVIGFSCDDWSEAAASLGSLDRFVTCATLPD